MKKIPVLILALCLCQVAIQAQSLIDAAFAISDDEAEGVVFIKDNKLICYALDEEEALPAISFDDAFEDFPFDHVDAALNDGNENLYLFSGSEYIKVDVETGLIEEGYPKAIREWSGMDFRTINAAVDGDNDKCYFFNQGHYSSYDKEKNAIDKTYDFIVNDSKWSNGNIDAAFTLFDGYTCLIKGEEYVLFNQEEGSIEEGYPRNISDFVGLKEALNGELPNPEPNPNVVTSDKGMEFFHGTWEEALAESKATGKLIFVDAYATWCGPCQWMAKSVFPVERVGTVYNQNFINYKFDMERGEGPAFARKYRVNAYPSLFFIDGNGKLVQKEEGALDVDELVSLGKKVAKNVMNVKQKAFNGSGGN